MNKRKNQIVRKPAGGSRPWSVFVLVAVAGVCLGVSPRMQAGCNNTPCAASDNTYFGMDAGNPGSGADNTAVGFDALFTNTSGIQNTAIGSQTLVANTEGYNNTAVGKTALQSNTTAIDGTAVGVAALQLNTTGNFNTGIGLSALTQNSTGTLNTAVGTSALYYSNGNSNTAIGANALGFVVGGGNNTAEGYKALYNTTGNNNIGLGSTAGVNLNTGDNNIDIGNPGTAGEANTIRIGVENTQTSAYVAGIYQQPVFGKAKAIRVDSTGKLGTVAGSSARFKEDIKPMNSVSDILLSLKPVTFRYKKALDPEKTPQFGLVAEQVEKVDRDLVEYDQQGKPDGVRYDAVNAMLLNEFIKEHHQVAEQGMIIDHLKSVGEDQQKEIKALTASLKEQAAQVQKVSDELTMERPAPRMVSSGQ